MFSQGAATWLPKSLLPLVVITLSSLVPALASGRSADLGSGHGTVRVTTSMGSGTKRSYLVHLPEVCAGHPDCPLVIAIHGAFADARKMEAYSGLSELADREGFVVAFPNGTGLLGHLRHWNSGHCCAYALKHGIDDVGFLAQVITELTARLRIDEHRVYVVGHSNGGMLAYRLAAERPALVAAVAVFAGTIGGRETTTSEPYAPPAPSLPVPVLVLHGTADDHVPYAGGHGKRSRGSIQHLSVADSVLFWVRSNGCMPQATRATLLGGDLIRESWRTGTGQELVVLCTLQGWSHSWPEEFFARRCPRAEDPGQGPRAARLIWSFVSRFHRCETGVVSSPGVGRGTLDGCSSRAAQDCVSP